MPQQESRMARARKPFPVWLNPEDEEDVSIWLNGEYIPSPDEIEAMTKDIITNGGGRNRSRIRANLLRTHHHDLGDWEIAQSIAYMISQADWLP